MRGFSQIVGNNVPGGRTGRPGRSDGAGCFASHIPTLVLPFDVKDNMASENETPVKARIPAKYKRGSILLPLAKTHTLPSSGANESYRDTEFYSALLPDRMLLHKSCLVSSRGSEPTDRIEVVLLTCRVRVFSLCA